MDLYSTFILLVAGPPAWVGCFLALQAGRRESRGQLGAARRGIRLGGFLICGGAAGAVVAALVALISYPASSGCPLLLTAALVSLGGSGFVALLAALSGKPRPSGTFAVALYLTGAVGLLWVLVAC